MSGTEVIAGTGVVTGAGYAPALWVRPRPELPTAADTGAVSSDEHNRFDAAADAVADRLAARAADASGPAAEVLQTTAIMTRDKGWRAAVRRDIDSGRTAEYSVAAATDVFAAMLESAGGVMAERVADLLDIRDRVIAELSGQTEPGLPEFSGEVVLLADDLSPADAASLDPERTVALVTELGGPTSHTAIIARQLGVPCVTAVGEALTAIETGEYLLVDGAQGTITRAADPATARSLVAASRARARRVAQWRGPAATADGHRIELMANVSDGGSAHLAARGQAEGIGLYRTELSFLSESAEPSVARQAAIYRGVFASFPTARIVVRTLDAGADKPLSYATLSTEDNPALGVRGLRVARRNERLLTHQLDAIAAAAAERPAGAATWVMAPMVSTEAEARWFGGLCRERGLTPGAMIEVPAAALMADKIMPHLDFVSIGTNDLAQYTMAADRLSPQLAYLTDPWQPAVLRLVRHTCVVARDHLLPVGVCGEAASDPLLACVLTGLGVQSLSAASGALPAVGAMLGELDLETCQHIAAAALSSGSAAEARQEALRVAGAAGVPR